MSVKSAPPAGAPAARVNLFELERTALHDLVHLVQARADAEAAAKAAFESATAAAERDLSRARKQVNVARDQTLAAIETTRQESLQKVTERYNTESQANERQRPRLPQHGRRKLRALEAKCLQNGELTPPPAY